MAAYIHDLSVDKWEPADSSDTDMVLSIRPESDWNKRPPGLVPFVSCRPGTYGRLLLAVYERRLTGLLVSSMASDAGRLAHRLSGPQTRFG